MGKNSFFFRAIESGRVSLNSYISGIMVANAPALMVNTYRNTIINKLSLTYQLLILGITTLIGGILAGYLTARKTGHSYQKAGITTGGLSYLLYIALSIVLKYLAIQYEDIVITIGFVIGGTIGAIYWTSNHRRTS